MFRHLKSGFFIIKAIALSTMLAMSVANAAELTVKDVIREFHANDLSFIGYVNGIVKGAVVHLTLIQNDCSPDGNRYSISSKVVERMANMQEIQNDERFDLAFYAISLRMFACDKGVFISGLPQMGLSE